MSGVSQAGPSTQDDGSSASAPAALAHNGGPSSGPLVGGGTMGALMRGVDWSATPLGALDRWPQSLRTIVSTCLNSRFPILVWWGPELVMLYNDAYVSLIGTKHPQALGAPGRMVFPEIWDIIGPMLGGVLAHGDATWSEDQLLLLDRHGYAEECYFTFSYSPIRDESGGVGGVFTAVTETTERVVGERRLATLRLLGERTAASRTVGDAVRGAIDVLTTDVADVAFAALYLADDDGRTARLSGTANVPASVDAPEVVALTEGAPIAGAGPDAGWPVAEVLRDARPRVLSLQSAVGSADQGDGAATRQALVLPVASAGQNRPRGVLVTGISPRRALDDAYHAYLTLLAGQVATALANAEAYETERRRAESLAELDRAKTAFFSNVSHEFRTPLTLILGPAEDVLGDPATSVADRARLEIIHRNALRLQRLVNTLLDFSRIEAGRVDATFQPTDLGTLTADLVSGFHSAIERAHLSLVIDCPRSEPVYVDRDMWEKIVLNLVSNAFKHTFEGTITIATRVTADGAELSVRDTGVGIPADQLPHIFDRFHRVPSTRSRSHEGTGIGLAMVQELVRLHGGVIDVESAPGAGTTFTVRLRRGASHLPADHIGTAEPIALDAGLAAPFVAESQRWIADSEPGDDAGAGGATAPSVPVTAAQSTRGARVLLADDNADMRDYLARLLRQQGWVVETAADGRAALDAAQAHRPDLVLADVMMPHVDGFGLLRTLRDDPTTRAIPVILLSARAGEESRIEGLGAGADDYLVKPFSRRELVARVAAHLGLAIERERAAAAVRTAHAELTAAHRALQVQAGATAEALAALGVEKARLAELFRQAPAFICVLRGPEHVVELANDSYKRLVGFRPLLGLPLREAIPEAAGQGYLTLLDRVLATGEPYVGREEPIALAGLAGEPPEVRFVTFVYQAIAEADGSRSGVFVLGNDVTDQVRARTEVERARAEAEEARRLAEEANRAKSEFLAAMSHELRTPLNAIAGYTELLEVGVYGGITPLQREPLERVRRSQQHLLSLINDVLNFAKIEAGRVEYRTEQLPLADVVAQVAPMVEPQLAAKRLSYDVRVDPGVVVRGDREKIQQILLNLLSNAVKFTGAGGRVMVETVSREGAPPDMVLLRVSDTGIGIARDKQEGIFDPFIQVHRNLTRSVGGTGLGLTISRDLARGMGGDLRVRSQEGGGSAFTLALPAA